MKIGPPVARFHPGNTGEYAQRALSSLGHDARILTVPAFFAALPKGEFDYFLCVDSSEAIPLNDPSISRCSFKQVGLFMNSGAEARQWILENATYRHRMQAVLEQIGR